jgi:septum formation protein
MPLILASSSAIRRDLLTAAGVAVTVEAPDFDEEPVKAAHHGDPESLAQALAAGKAASLGGPDWTIGADSLVSVGGRRFSKPRDRDEARDHLTYFSAREMRLTSAAALARQGRVDWSCSDTARLFVRPLSAPFIEAYLDAEWPAIGYCAGAFRMEARGPTLFERIEGSHFTILGLPLLPLLGALRDRGVLPA